MKNKCEKRNNKRYKYKWCLSSKIQQNFAKGYSASPITVSKYICVRWEKRRKQHKKEQMSLDRRYSACGKDIVSNYNVTLFLQENLRKMCRISDCITVDYIRRPSLSRNNFAAHVSIWVIATLLCSIKNPWGLITRSRDWLLIMLYS